MKFYSILILLSIFVVSCKSRKTVKNDISNTEIITNNVNDSISPVIIEKEIVSDLVLYSEASNLTLNLIDFAKQFEGVKYKFGGTTKAGMDCSGLVYETFKAFDISLPRVSRDMAKLGQKIFLEDIKEGDLLFFKTSNKRNIISHVGLVVTALPGNVEFIHSTTKQGVIISSLAERYWYYSFAEARRIL